MQKVRLSDLTTKIGSGATPKGGSNAYKPEGISLIRSQNILDLRFSYDGLAFIDEDQAFKLSNVEVKENDILLNITGDSVARVCKVDGKSLPARVNQHVAIIRSNPDLLDSDYLLYVLVSRGYKGALLSLASAGATRNALTKGMIENFEIPYRELEEQKAIAHILGTLDDKIELNRQMNRTLEQMAQALFKSWFVDYDPVIDKALKAGNEIPKPLQKKAQQRQQVPNEKKLIHTNPGLTGHAELVEAFPDRFTFTEELGWIPEGWEAAMIADFGNVIGGGTPSTKVPEYYTDNGIPWLSPKDLSGYHWKFVSRGEKDITNEGLAKSSAKLLPEGTVLFSSRAPIGYIAIARNKVSTNQGFKSVIVSKPEYTDYLYYFLKSNIKSIEAIASGSTFKEVSGSALKGFDVLKPTDLVLQEFSNWISSLNGRLKTLQDQTEIITNLRNTLLPKLISGELRVPEAEQIIADHV